MFSLPQNVMKTPLFIIVGLLSVAPLAAQNRFPGLKEILSATEWKRAGLDRLSPDEIGVIDAALIRHSAATEQAHAAELNAERRRTAEVASTGGEKKRSFLERFGFSERDEPDWREQPPLQANVTAWVSANRFKLDNGQIWEGLDTISFELVGKPIEIRARPHGKFALTIDGWNSTLRVRRVL